MPREGPQRRLLVALNATPRAAWLATNQVGPQCLEVISDGPLGLGLVSLLESVLVVATAAENRSPHCPTNLLTGCLAVSSLLMSVSSMSGMAVTLLLEVGTLGTQATMAQQLASVLNPLTYGSWVPSLRFLAAVTVDQDLCIFSVLPYHSIMTLPKVHGHRGGQRRFQHPLRRLLCPRGRPAASHQPPRGHAEAHPQPCLLHGQQHLALQGFGLQGLATLTTLLGSFLPCWGPFFLHLLIVLCPQHPTCHCIFENFHLCLALVTATPLQTPRLRLPKPAAVEDAQRHCCAPWGAGAGPGEVRLPPSPTPVWLAQSLAEEDRLEGRVSGGVAAWTHWGQRGISMSIGELGEGRPSSLTDRHTDSGRAPSGPTHWDKSEAAEGCLQAASGEGVP
ncbi:LOW QUALITY PROTEIN: melanocyte-stimulating hormone receptor [Glossophaga mutica]